MKLCMDCNEVSREEELVFKEDTDTGTTWSFCPHCGGEDLEEAQECPGCEEWFPVIDMEGVYCLDCQIRTLEKWRALLKRHFSGKPDHYQACITEQIDEKGLWGYSD